MTNEDDIIIIEVARAICSNQTAKREMSLYMSGARDDTVWMRLVKEGIRKGIEIGRSL